MAASEQKEWLLHSSLFLFLGRPSPSRLFPGDLKWDRAGWREKLGRNTYPQLPFQGNNFSTASLCCWKYLNTVLPSVCCKQYPFTREKVQSTDPTLTQTPLWEDFHPVRFILRLEFTLLPMPLQYQPFDPSGAALNRMQGQAVWRSSVFLQTTYTFL